MIGCVFGSAGEPVRIEGNAYDFGHAVRAVQFSLDEGQHWTTYETAGTNDYQNLTWSFEFTPPRQGSYRMLVRAVNERDDASPEPATVELRIA